MARLKSKVVLNPWPPELEGKFLSDKLTDRPVSDQVYLRLPSWSRVSVYRPMGFEGIMCWELGMTAMQSGRDHVGAFTTARTLDAYLPAGSQA